ncbi:hypothetical protein H6784_04475 [Candidatus Nomurabacteria bacterium]|nr:hypothetical protein [Candidatus Nomurabacteria bacterium]
MSESISTLTTEGVTQTSNKQSVFQSENAWMVQCLSLATIGLLTYIHIAPMVYAAH